MIALHRRQGRVGAALALGVAIGSGGCLGLEKSYPDRQFFMLDAVRPAGGATPPAAAGESLKVKALRAAPQCEGKELVYRRGKDTFESDFYHLFFVSPAPMTTEIVRKWLADAQLFEHVVDAGSQLDSSFVLEGSIRSLHADLSGEAATAVIELQLFLFDDRQQASRIVYQRDFARSIPIADRTPAALVAGWNRGLVEILTELESEWRGAGWLAPRRPDS